MPWIRKGKCVYKKNKDGSKGKEQGCSDSIEKAKDYLKALYANVDDATKKENKTMKITRDILKQIIKEELDYMGAEIEDISDEDELGLTDPRYFDQPDVVHGDSPVFDSSTFKKRLMAAIEAGNFDNLEGENLEFAERFLKDFSDVKKQFPRRQKGAMDVEAEPMMQEGIENITPENLQLVMEAVKKLVMNPYTGPIIVAAFAAVGLEGIKEMLAGRGGEM